MSRRTGYTEETLPLSVLAALMEVRPISACEPIVAYIEARVGPLTKVRRDCLPLPNVSSHALAFSQGMEYQRGRGPILLRLLNDLLRRLPRSQSQSVILSGRILMLLSSAYPLGEKSGVNLRGNFNIGKGTVFEQEAEKEMEGAKEDAKKEDVKMEVEEGEEEELPKDAENPAESASARLPLLTLAPADVGYRVSQAILLSSTRPSGLSSASSTTRRSSSPLRLPHRHPPTPTPSGHSRTDCDRHSPLSPLRRRRRRSLQDLQRRVQ